MNYPVFIKAASGFFSRNRLFFLFLLIYLAFITYFFRGISSLDPDFGWRLRVGEIIMRQGIPKTDPFSYTMGSFPFVDHSWFFSLLIALTFPVFSNGLSSLILTFFIFASLFIAMSRLNEAEDFQHADLDARYEKWLHPMVVTIIAFFLLFFSVRAQIVSWLNFAVLNLLLFRKDNYSRYKYFLPVIFLIWANLHGGYSLGIMILVYFVVFRFVINKKGSWKDVLILILSILATLVTPYRFEGWREVASSLFDSRLRWTIAEWMPSVTFFDMSMVFYIAMSTFMVFFKRKGLPKIQYILFWGLLILGISSRRNMPYFMLYSLPLTAISINKLYLDVADNKDSRERFRIAFGFIRVFSVLLLIFQMYFTYWKTYVSDNMTTRGSDFYPVEAVSYLKGKSLQGEIFSSYGWGGFLIWQLPGKKVFIDGRMPSWKFTPKDLSKETSSAYDDYLAIEKGDLDFNSVSDKYNIEYVLWPKEKVTLLSSLEKKIKNINFFGKKDDDFSFTEYLNKNGWSLIYMDPTSEVYTRLNGMRI